MYQFLLGQGHLPKEADKIAKRHEAALINYTEPSGEKRYWFECENLGIPFDRDTSKAVEEDLITAGIIEESCN